MPRRTEGNAIVLKRTGRALILLPDGHFARHSVGANTRVRVGGVRYSVKQAHLVDDWMEVEPCTWSDTVKHFLRMLWDGGLPRIDLLKDGVFAITPKSQ